jgi:hypothetical protein
MHEAVYSHAVLSDQTDDTYTVKSAGPLGQTSSQSKFTSENWAIPIGAPARAAQSKRAGATPDFTQIKLTAVNPKGTPPAIQVIPMAPRLDTLDSKTVCLVDHLNWHA